MAKARAKPRPPKQRGLSTIEVLLKAEVAGLRGAAAAGKIIRPSDVALVVACLNLLGLLELKAQQRAIQD